MPSREEHPAPPPSVEDCFGPRGILAASMPGWEDRPGQLEMAREIEAAIGEKRNLIVEAGTGTGKTLAYLIPLALAGRRAVISTGTKNLQEQLARKDVPFLEGALGKPLQVAVMKGRNNFLCIEKLAEQERKPALSGMQEASELALIRDWAGQTATGDRSDLEGLAEDSRLWPRLDARREACPGQECGRFSDCFVTKMRQRAREADLVVVNHHLFFADLAMREDEDDFGPIIPPHETVVFDEAHEIEGVAGQFFGQVLSNHQVEDLARQTLASAKQAGFASQELDAAVKFLRASAKEFFALFDDFQPRQIFSERGRFRTDKAKEYGALQAALDGLGATLSLVRERGEETRLLRGRAGQIKALLSVLLGETGEPVLAATDGNSALAALADDHTDNFVYWVDKRGSGVYLHATPIDLAPILEERLFRQHGSVVLASATLAVEGSFEYVRSRLGLHAANESVIPGHFDFRQQALLYLPAGMPEPRAREFPARAAGEIQAVLEITRGRAFVLFTSHRQMREVHRLVSKALGFPCLLQGQGSNAEVLDRFRRTRNCVLFATASFWQGVDVPGAQLSCVIIDKLPFAVPSDPLVHARTERINAQGGNAFREYQIPQAILALKQGFGRLIRSAADRGVLVMLDSRILAKQYGKIFLDSLPDYARTQDLGAVAGFFDR
ncbi:MAG: ATP-dependent DNA helicase [Bryobacterales bacterium]|nr:ATP-dependent DNA helicase [Bryobacterales bacterium]